MRHGFQKLEATISSGVTHDNKTARIIVACENLEDVFTFSVLARIGQAINQSVETIRVVNTLLDRADKVPSTNSGSAENVNTSYNGLYCGKSLILRLSWSCTITSGSISDGITKLH